MYVSKISLINYRNFENVKLLFKKGVNTIIGENGSGKTNLFRAMRLLLDDRLVHLSYRLDEQDFCRSRSTWKGHWIIISLEFKEISQDESIQTFFLHSAGNIKDNQFIDKATYNLIFRPNLGIREQLSDLEDGDYNGMEEILESITIDDYETIFTGRSTADFNDKQTYEKIAGDFENAIFSNDLKHPEIGTLIPKALSLQKEISFTFIQALRDVVSEFHNNRKNPLLSLLKNKSGEIDIESFQPIADQVVELNTAIEGLNDVKNVKNDIDDTIKLAVGETYSPSSLAIKSALPNEAEKLFQSLKLFVGEYGEGYEEAVHELSLGGANLIYLTLKLLEFRYQKSRQSLANFLLIEEPEAHIHTHIQKTLFDKLDFSDTQIIYSTHSTHISEVSSVRRINILSKAQYSCESYQPHTGLDDHQVDRIQRYLDAVRSNLLFAKSVLLVEGDAEEILIPVLVERVLGITLDELGISLINIRSTGFENIALLFHDSRIRKKCSIITDLDKSITDTIFSEDDSTSIRKFKEKCETSERLGQSRKNKLDNFSKNNQWVNVFYAPHTFEIDFMLSGNKPEIIETLSDIYKQESKIERVTLDLESEEIFICGHRLLKIAEKLGKGWFAILLSKFVTYETYIPEYILNAIFHARSDFSLNIWFDIFKHRISCIEKHEENAEYEVNQLKQILILFKNRKIDLFNFINNFSEIYSDDQIVDIVEMSNVALEE